jgi:hypothetical protein
VELNTISLSVFTQLANVIFEKKKMSLKSAVRESGLFKVEAVPENTGNIRQLTEIDQNEYARFKGESDQASRAKIQQGYTKNLQSYRVAADIGISYEMRTQNKYQEVISRLENLASQAVNRMDLDLSHRITFGTATSYTDQDGRSVDVSVGDTLSLFNTAHTLKGSSSTYRNRLANNPQVSKGALEGMEKMVVENTLNQFGEKVVANFDKIFTTDDPNTINTVREYLRSVAGPDFANSGVDNVYKGKYTHVIFPRIATDANGAVDSTKAKYWGLFSTEATTLHLKVWEEPHLKTPAPLGSGSTAFNSTNGEEFSTDDWNFGVRAGYGIAGLSGQGIMFSSGDGTP